MENILIKEIPLEEADLLSTWTPVTELGRELLAIRKKIIASGLPLLDWEGVACELESRRGEHDQNIS